LMADVDALVASLLEKNVPIDVIINNAGALFNQRRETEEGLEQSFALLLLSPYRLVNGIKPLLGRGSRVINVVSGGMYSQRLEVDALHSSALPYKGASAYALAKRALVVLTEQWAQSWSEEGVVVNSMHPGWADTPGVESSLPAFYRLTKSILRTPEQGADTIVWLANATEAGKVSGKLFLDREPQPTHLVKSTRESEDERLRLEQLMDVLGSTAPDDLAAVVLETIVDSSDHLLVS
jgi:dehydrogenase/reductase SDR family protein 12